MDAWANEEFGAEVGTEPDKKPALTAFAAFLYLRLSIKVIEYISVNIIAR